MDDYTAQAKIYWWVTAVLGLLVLGACLVGVSRVDSGKIVLIATGSLMAAIAGLFPVSIPGAKVSVSAAEIFVFLLLLSFGTEAAVIAAAIEAACISWRTSTRWTSRIGSPAMAALAMYVSGNLFTWASTQLSIVGKGGMIATVPLLVAAVAVVYFAIGTLLTASLIKLKRNEPIKPLDILRDHAWLGLAYACSGAIAGLLQSSFGQFEFAIVLAAAPITAALIALLHVYYRHAPRQA